MVQGKDIALCLVAIVLPPLAVYINQNKLNGVVCLNLILTIFVWLPGVIHAIWVILKGHSVKAVRGLEDATEALIPDL
ncbi:hypothetical protein CHLNCDRAFT_135997 [Chlorella variabilis]|uniref:Uncharacterized protein n=1 Tax=Chlorella variabilis TaxID=554065 RepID=E1ZJI4_CHLVA|nr:hypothetical protein CHLNCDRAFT_135997 [Chlorella variabilis]EFN53869.1 hypothetical protein CHLNCDRAFT_135997 [Chlorella variabilis]|eukprot:XP_005845971.1 hypothetical protein CHLNCDRAFT_135997 [Chlorella variabilis]